MTQLEACSNATSSGNCDLAAINTFDFNPFEHVMSRLKTHARLQENKDEAMEREKIQ